MDLHDSELLSRLEAGPRVFWPADSTDEALEAFQITARRLLVLRDRGLVRLPEGRITRDRAGRVILLGPCELTNAGRDGLEHQTRRVRPHVGGNRARASRQARLRPEAADLYPNVPRNVWLPAAWLTDLLLVRWTQQRAASPATCDRVLDPTHFEFRCLEPNVLGRSGVRRVSDSERCY